MAASLRSLFMMMMMMMMMMLIMMTMRAMIKCCGVQYFRVRLQRPATTSYLFVDVFPHNASEFTVIIIIIISIIINIIIMTTR